MTKTAYILTFDRNDDQDTKAIHDKITNLPNIKNWFHYIKSSYILISDLSNATDLNNILLKILKNQRYLLIEINLKNRNGRLPNNAWIWLRKQITVNK